jgi:hypothetical protein
LKWFKLHNDIIHDPKVRCLAFEDRWHFVALMCLTNDGTLDEPVDVRDQLVEVALGLTGVDLHNLKRRLMQLRLVGEDWKPTRWEDRQTSKDPTGAERQRRYRESQKAAKRDVTPLRNGGVTDVSRTEEEEEEEVTRKNSRELNISFDDFWAMYPRKVGKAKAKQRWPRLTNSEREQAVLFLRRNPYADRDAQFIPQGDTFLNKRPWEDDDQPDTQSLVGGVRYFQ